MALPKKAFTMVPTSLTAVFLLAGMAPRARAQAPARAEPARLSAAQRAAALQQIQDEIQRFYVFPEKRAGIIGALGKARQAGRYELDSPTAFADAITDDLRAASQDGHLSLRYDPAWYDDGIASAGAKGGDEGRLAAERRSTIRDNHGLTELKLLPCNIRYLKITGFGWVRDETGAAYDAAMRFLGNGDAIILDLRGNGGGHHSATRYLISHFLDEDVLLYTFLSQKEPDLQSRTLDSLPAGRLKGKPLYVLIDSRVRSAGEDVAYQVQQYKLGELVGATTAGAANNNELVAVAPGFRLSVSIGRPVHPVSNTNWEGLGIRPTVESPPAQALERAQLLALTELAKNPPADSLSRAEIAWAREGIEARLHPVSVPVSRLHALAGTFGPVTVTFRDNALWMKRPDRELARLLPMSDDLFAIEGSDFLRVRLTPASLALQPLGAPEPRIFTRPRS